MKEQEDNRRKYGWITIDERYVNDDDFWQELIGIFWPHNHGNLSYTIDGLTHIFGYSDHFSSYGDQENPFNSPIYEVIFVDYDDDDPEWTQIGAFYRFKESPCYV